MNHILILSPVEIENIISGSQQFVLRFFKKRPEFFDQVHSGDLVFFRKGRGDVLGQFEIGKLIKIEKLGKEDLGFIKEVIGQSIKEREFEELIEGNILGVVIQINKLEQFLTSPIEIDKRSKKEWIILQES